MVVHSGFERKVRRRFTRDWNICRGQGVVSHVRRGKAVGRRKGRKGIAGEGMPTINSRERRKYP